LRAGLKREVIDPGVKRGLRRARNPGFICNFLYMQAPDQRP
jgi:hypothetical protein